MVWFDLTLAHDNFLQLKVIGLILLSTLIEKKQLWLSVKVTYTNILTLIC